MPLKGDRKREYQRRYMQRRHGFQSRGVGKKGLLGGDLDPTLDPLLKGNFRPTNGKELTLGKLVAVVRLGDAVLGEWRRVRVKPLTPQKLGETKDARWMRRYATCLAARGLGLVETGRGWEFLDLVTGEVGVYGGGAWKGVAALQERVKALERAWVQHQAEHVVQEAPRGYKEWLLEEEGMGEEELYTQHPTEHTLREEEL